MKHMLSAGCAAPPPPPLLLLHARYFGPRQSPKSLRTARCCGPPHAAHPRFYFSIIITHNEATQLHDCAPTMKTRVGSCAQLHTISLLSVATTATSPKLSHKQGIILRLIFTSLLQSGRCSHLSRSERARSPHFLDCDALDRAALAARVSAQGEPEGLGVLPTVVSDRTAMPHSADRHNKTTSRPTQNTLRGSAPPRTAGPVGAAPRLSINQWAGASSPPRE